MPKKGMMSALFMTTPVEHKRWQNDWDEDSKENIAPGDEVIVDKKSHVTCKSASACNCILGLSEISM